MPARQGYGSAPPESDCLKKKDRAPKGGWKPGPACWRRRRVSVTYLPARAHGSLLAQHFDIARVLENLHHNASVLCATFRR